MADSIDSLLSMFSQLGTTDHEELIRQFQIILPKITHEVCNFFLSANNWNLANAVSSYFDHNSDIGGNDLNHSMPNSCFQLQDDGVNQYYPDTVFYKKWLVNNSGTESWPDNSTLKFIAGDRLGGPAFMQAPPLPSGQTIDVTLSFRTPSVPGDYAGCWQLAADNDNSKIFGEPIWIIVSVIPNPNHIKMGWGMVQSFQSNQ